MNDPASPKSKSPSKDSMASQPIPKAPSKADLAAETEALKQRVAAIPVVAATMEVYGDYDLAMEQAEFYLAQTETRPVFAASSSAS